MYGPAACTSGNGFAVKVADTAYELRHLGEMENTLAVTTKLIAPLKRSTRRLAFRYEVGPSKIHKAITRKCFCLSCRILIQTNLRCGPDAVEIVTS